MYKAFIVDDDPSIRAGLRKILPWEVYGIEVQGEASNGLEAFNFISMHHPDIIICDIGMPVMNGLELIKKVRVEGLHSRFIILSGYNEFQYVKEALKYNVENYLLKPVNEEELEQTINQIITKLDSGLHRNSVSDHELLKNNILNRVITNQIDVFELKNRLKHINTGIDLLNSKLQVLVIDTLIIDTSKKNEFMDLIKEMEKVCKQVLPLEMGIVFLDMNGRIVIIYKVLNEMAFKGQIQAIINSIYDYTPALSDSKWIITAGDIVIGYKNLHISFQNALSIQQYRLYYREHDIIFYDDIKMNQTTNNKLFAIDYDFIEGSILNCNGSEIIHYLNSSFRQLIHNDMTPDAVYTFAIEFITSLLRIIRTQKISISAIFEDETLLLQTIHGFNDIMVLKQWLEDKIIAVISTIEQQNAVKFSIVIKDLLHYIDLHYNEGLSLKDYSRTIHYNPIYLGRLFKSETGEVFSDYVTKVRIEKSKELLKNSRLNINEISLSVGFSNPNYYCRIFKNLVGKTPSEFRK